MKVITLSEDTIIDGMKYLKGQLAQVDDSFDTNIKKVVATTEEIKARSNTEE